MSCDVIVWTSCDVMWYGWLVSQCKNFLKFKKFTFFNSSGMLFVIALACHRHAFGSRISWQTSATSFLCTFPPSHWDDIISHDKDNPRPSLVLCPALPVTNSLVNKVELLGLIPQKWWAQKRLTYHFPYNRKIFSSLLEYPYLYWTGLV